MVLPSHLQVSSSFPTVPLRADLQRYLSSAAAQQEHQAGRQTMLAAAEEGSAAMLLQPSLPLPILRKVVRGYQKRLDPDGECFLLSDFCTPHANCMLAAVR